MKTLMLAAVFSLMASFAQAQTPLSASDGWVRWVPPVSGNSAAYFTLSNQSDKAAVLVAADSDVAKAVEIHAVEKQGELMQMKQVESLSIPAGDEVVFQPGSYHIMLIGLKAPLQEGQKVALSLRFEGGDSVAVSLPVQKEAGQHAGHDHHDHDHHNQGHHDHDHSQHDHSHHHH